MKLFRVYEAYDGPYCPEKTVFILCDTFREAEEMFLERHSDKKIDRIGVQEEEVIIKGMS